MIITLTEKVYTEYEDVIEKIKIKKTHFYGLYSKWVEHDVIHHVPIYSKFYTKIHHINIDEIKELKECEHHTLIMFKSRRPVSGVFWGQSFNMSVKESVKEIQRMCK